MTNCFPSLQAVLISKIEGWLCFREHVELTSLMSVVQLNENINQNIFINRKMFVFISLRK